MLPTEIAKVSLADLKDVHKRFYVPKNATLILAGDIDATATKLAETKLGAWTGGEPPLVAFPPAVASKPRATRHIVVCDRPKSAQSDVFLVNLAPERRTPTWPAVRVANQILGGGVASRLFTDVREQRSLAYSARSQIIELANGEQPLLAYAGTETKKTALALQGLLENFDKMKQGVTPTEAETARRYLSDIFAIRMETLGAIADMVVVEETLRLPPGYWDKYREDLRAIDAPAASAAAGTLVKPDTAVVVVSGDADLIAPALTHFGEVTVLNPEAEFKVTKTLPMNPAAPLEITPAR
jgi:predicted Zn-dependent peptidase